MKDFVSTRRFGFFALVTSMPVVWLACSILVPSGYPWMGLAWVGLALSAALWLDIRSTPSMAQVLHHAEAAPIPAVASKSGRPLTRPWVHVAWLSLLSVSLLAGTPDPAANLAACKNGAPSCDRSRLTLLEVTQVALARHARNVANCRSGLSSCDPWNLTDAEAIAVAVTAYDRNVANCMTRLDSCDHSRLTRSEAREVAGADPQLPPPEARKEGRNTGNYSLLSPAEAQAMTSAERARNYTACLSRRGYCDRSRLTRSEAASIPREVR